MEGIHGAVHRLHFPQHPQQQVFPVECFGTKKGRWVAVPLCTCIHTLCILHWIQCILELVSSATLSTAMVVGLYASAVSIKVHLRDLDTGPRRKTRFVRLPCAQPRGRVAPSGGALVYTQILTIAARKHRTGPATIIFHCENIYRSHSWWHECTL